MSANKYKQYVYMRAMHEEEMVKIPLHYKTNEYTFPSAKYPDVTYHANYRFGKLYEYYKHPTASFAIYKISHKKNGVYATLTYPDTGISTTPYKLTIYSDD